MRGVLGGSLIAVAGLAAPQALAGTFEIAAARHLEAWQIVAEAQLAYVVTEARVARVIAVDPELTAREPSPADFSPAVAEQIQAEKPQTEKTPVTHVAAANTPAVEGAVTTAALADAPATLTPAVMVAPALVHPPMPRIRPLNAPKPPAVNSREDICNTLAQSAQQHNLPLAFFGNLIYQESGLKPRIVSHVGARGIAQFMPGTARMVGLKNPFNPREALPASAKFLRTLLRTFNNNYGLAAAAYNAGPGKVSRWLKRRTVLPKETRDYVMTITGQGAEHWRGIRGNKFGHRLARRMPCASMVQFAHADEAVVEEKGVLHAVYMTLPRPHPLRVAGKFASALPMASISLTSTAEAAPAPSLPTAPVVVPAVETATTVQKDETRPENVNAPAPAVATVAAATESLALPRIAPTNEQTTGSVTTVMKSEPSPKPEKLASIVPSEKPAAVTARFVAPLPRANPLREAKLTAGKNSEKHADKSEKKSEKKTDKKSDRKNDKKADKHTDTRKKRRA